MKIGEFLIAAQGPKIGKRKVSPEAFLSHFKDWMLSFPGIRSKIETCFRGLESGKMFPTPTLAYIIGLIATEKNLVLKAKDSKDAKEEHEAKDPKAKGKKSKEVAPKREKKQKKYSITIYVKEDPYNAGKWNLGRWDGNIRPEEETNKKLLMDKDLGKPVWKDVQANYFTADTFQEAMGIADRKLDQNENSVWADIMGHGSSIRVHRVDALSRVHAKKKGASTKRVAKVSSNLGWGPRSKAYHQHFSHG